MFTAFRRARITSITTDQDAPDLFEPNAVTSNATAA
jgi:hypothetical protein